MSSVKGAQQARVDALCGDDGRVSVLLTSGLLFGEATAAGRLGCSCRICLCPSSHHVTLGPGAAPSTQHQAPSTEHRARRPWCCGTRAAASCSWQAAARGARQWWMDSPASPRRCAVCGRYLVMCRVGSECAESSWARGWGWGWATCQWPATHETHREHQLPTQYLHIYVSTCIVPVPRH
jgi:hypothetical protein